ncbi:hypothetical protein K523DRAFT_326532 [Schizophyllum commune Tattone D]|nr:hypothetical protein K523DRAFT_326532 [Schizophyllum commune Tattone D]
MYSQGVRLLLRDITSAHPYLAYTRAIGQAQSALDDQLKIALEPEDDQCASMSLARTAENGAPGRDSRPARCSRVSVARVSGALLRRIRHGSSSDPMAIATTSYSGFSSRSYMVSSH